MFSTLGLAVKVKVYNSLILRFFLNIYKYVVHLITGTTEIYRICQGVVASSENTECQIFYSNVINNPKGTALFVTRPELGNLKSSVSSNWSIESVYSSSPDSSERSATFPYFDGTWQDSWLGKWIYKRREGNAVDSSVGSSATPSYPVCALYLPWSHLLFARDLPDFCFPRRKMLQEKPEAFFPPFGWTFVQSPKLLATAASFDARPKIAVSYADTAALAIAKRREQPVVTPLKSLHQRAITDTLDARGGKITAAFGTDNDENEKATIAELGDTPRSSSDSSDLSLQLIETPQENVVLNTSLLLEMMNVTANIVSLVDLSIFYSKKLSAERRILESKDGNLKRLSFIIPRVMKAKKFCSASVSEDSAECAVLEHCLRIIASTNKLIHSLNDRASVPFDSDNKQHEKKLGELWSALRLDIPFPGPSSHRWQNLGFQSSCPATDFRSSGMLALDNLIYFAKTYPNIASRLVQAVDSNHAVLSSSGSVLKSSIRSRRMSKMMRKTESESNKLTALQTETAPASAPAKSDSRWTDLYFGLSGIHLTHFTLSLARTRELHHFFFKYGCTKENYQELYCWVFSTLIDDWYAESRSLRLVDFGKFFKDFQKRIIRQITLQECCLLDERAILEKRQGIFMSQILQDL